MINKVALIDHSLLDSKNLMNWYISMSALCGKRLKSIKDPCRDGVYGSERCDH